MITKLSAVADPHSGEQKLEVSLLPLSEAGRVFLDVDAAGVTHITHITIGETQLLDACAWDV